MADDKLAQAEAKKAEGNTAFAKKEYETAIGFYSEAIALDAKNHLYYSNRSICYAETGKFNEAKADGEQCVALDPAFVKGYHRKANAEFLLGDLDAATSSIRDGLKRDPTMSELTKLLRKVKAKREKMAVSARRQAAGPSADAKADAGLRRELQELGEQFNDTNAELQEVKAKLEASGREMRRTDLTKDEIMGLPEEVPLYRSVGKMFLRSERAEVDTFIAGQQAHESKARAELTSRQMYLQRRMQSQEANLKDLMASLVGPAGAPGAEGTTAPPQPPALAAGAP